MTNSLSLQITDRSVFAGGHAFGDAGDYERLSGRVRFAVDPRAEPQRDIVDLDRAPVNADGRVEFAADVMLLKPADMARANRRVFFDYGNRGHKRALQFFNDAPASDDPTSLAHAGNGFLFRRGYVVAWLAWEGDLLPGNGRMIIDVPIATDGSRPITGQVRVEYIAEEKGITTFPLSGRWPARSYPAASLDTSQAMLTRRRYPDDARVPIPGDAWCFGRLEEGSGGENAAPEQAVVPSERYIHLYDGFRPGWIYELIYTARDPLVHGLGHLVVRDFVSFLKYADADAAGQPNPVRGVEKVYGWGRSQTGRCLRDFVYRGFNADAQGRRVFDGVLSHVAGAGRKWLNHRFASPIVSGGQQYEDHHSIADSFPFSYASSVDHLTGKRDAILKRPDTDPLVIHTQTATEYWVRRGSLVHTDTQGNDLAQPDNVRVYAWTSSQHFADPVSRTPARGTRQNPFNIVATSMFFRAMLDAMDAWASDGKQPPPSRVPTRGDGTLVPIEQWREQFPAIPGVAVPRTPNTFPLLDFGPQVERGILKEPPEIVPGKEYTVLVPAVDADGNDSGGVRAPMVAAPLATYTGWNLRAHGFGHGALFRFEGSTIPFPETPEERRVTGDPRRSILERYPDSRAYVAAIAEAAKALVAQGLMLEEDVERCATAAADWGRPRHVVELP